ncbi:MAG: Co2+/Mg2+ efflux protein ApaG [Methylobacteriaceae bacterium]|nr:Co2+/Mg2+ efflux protein ApaG [Methylobacteriaceae bacterium]
MYKAVTRNIEVTVLPEFLPDRSEPSEGRFVWAYTIEITNHSDQAVQLKSRHWIITDARGHVEEVRGPGVVGEQPVLNPGDAFRYTSGCPLSTPSGIMSGTYRMAGADGRAFDIEIPAFSLDSPYAKRVLN